MLPRQNIVVPRVVQSPRTAIPLPQVEPLLVAAITEDDARIKNAALPFVVGPIAAASSWRFSGTAVSYERAVTCLAAAEWWEAGDDASGQRAVAQVVLNRLRHPAFPKSICGVVFQGSERTTGCQFTFTCDGALARVPRYTAWQRARHVAEMAMNGAVDRRVGTATHYHTDWVVPAWNSSLDKVAQVGTHLFYRWKGWWGTPAAFRGAWSGPERLDERIIHLAGPAAAAEDFATASAGDQATPILDDAVAVERVYTVALDPQASSATYKAKAISLCRRQSVCAVYGWINPERMPKTRPVTPAMKRSVSFMFRRHVELGREQALWNCIQLPQADSSKCIPGTEPDPG